MLLKFSQTLHRLFDIPHRIHFGEVLFPDLTKDELSYIGYPKWYRIKQKYFMLRKKITKTSDPKN